MANSNELLSLLSDAAKETGRNLDVSQQKLREVAATQMAQLALAVGEPGYDRAVIAARDIIALEAGLQLHSAASAADSRLVGIIQGALFFGAKAL